MTGLVTNWRLKVLALLMAIGLLAAVAFSQNPVTLKAVQARIDYSTTSLRPNLVLVNPLGRASVTVFGPSGAVNSLPDGSVKVSVNLSSITSKGSYTVTGNPVVAASGVNVQSGSISIPIRVENLVETLIDVEVRVTTAPGWTLQPSPMTRAVCGNATQPCRVHVTAPESVTTDLKAYVQVDGPPFSNSSDLVPNLTIKFEQGGRPVDLTKVSSLPVSGFDPVVAAANLEAKRGSASKTVNLLISVTGRPACGYRVASVDINQGNNVATLSGPSDVISKQADTVQLNAIDIAGATTTISSSLAIPVPTGVTAAPNLARVTVTIERQFDCAAPTPSPLPSPVPSASPR